MAVAMSQMPPGHLHAIPKCYNGFSPIGPIANTDDLLVDDPRAADEVQFLGVLDGVVDEDHGVVGLVDH